MKYSCFNRYFILTCAFPSVKIKSHVKNVNIVIQLEIRFELDNEIKQIFCVNYSTSNKMKYSLVYSLHLRTIYIYIYRYTCIYTPHGILPYIFTQRFFFLFKRPFKEFRPSMFGCGLMTLVIFRFHQHLLKLVPLLQPLA